MVWLWGLNYSGVVLYNGCACKAIQDLCKCDTTGFLSKRYGEKSTPFCVTQLEGPKCDGDFSRRINNAVERASSDYHSGTSSDEEGDSIISNISSNISGNMSGNISSSIGSSISSINCSSNSSCLSAPEQKTIPTVSNPNSVYQVRLTDLIIIGVQTACVYICSNL